MAEMTHKVGEPIQLRSARFPWVNIWAPRDVISGSLDSCDHPNPKKAPADKKVRDVADEDVLIPMVAHLEYWSNPKVFSHLYNGIRRQSGASASSSKHVIKDAA